MNQKIDLNGVWELQYNNGAPIDINIPCAVEQVMEKKDYYGPFIFIKKFHIDKLDTEKSVSITFGGVSYDCEVAVNESFVCKHEGIWDSFCADVTNKIKVGENTLKVTVYKPDFDKNSPNYFRSVLFGFIPDVMMPFGGIWKDVTLKILGNSYFKKITADFSKENKSIIFHSELNKEPGEDLSLSIKIICPNGQCMEVHRPYAPSEEIKLTDCYSWSLETPATYLCDVKLMNKGNVLDEKEITGGFRNIGVSEGEILLDGVPFYMRGILHWGCYPDKMSPNLSYEEAREELRNIKEMGFNTVKLCLFFPPEYYYELCDEMGIVIWQELPLWLPYNNQYLEERIKRQYPEMLHYFMSHPCVSVVSIGCELNQTVGADILNHLYDLIKQREGQMIICDNSGSGECFEGGRDSKSDIYDYHFYAELFQLNNLIREFTHEARQKKPWLFGEFNDFDTMRLLHKNKEDKAWWENEDESLNPLRKVHKGFDSDQPVYIQNEIFEEYGVSEEIKGLDVISTLQMKDIRKFILETTRSTPTIKGYNITTIQDVPITTAGIFDSQMKPKVTKEFMEQINGDVVISYQKDLARVWKSGADCFANKDRYHYFEEEAINGRLVLSNRSNEKINSNVILNLKYQDETIVKTEIPCDVECHQTLELDHYSLILPKVGSARRYTLEVKLSWSGKCYSNQWDIWCYPPLEKVSEIYLYDNHDNFVGIEDLFLVKRIYERSQLDKLKSKDILLTTCFDESIRQTANRGVHVICTVKSNGFLPITKVPFYREGVIRLVSHPVIDQLRHKGYAGLQFFGMAASHAFDKKELENVIGNYHTLMRRYDARKFKVAEYLIEFIQRQGKVLATTLNFNGGNGEQPNCFKENKQAVWLLYQMIKYLGEQENEE